MPENVQISARWLKTAHVKLVELYNLQKNFISIGEMSSKDRNQYFEERLAEKKSLKISFQTFEELNSLQAEKKFKISSRTTLGIKGETEDDWVATFNIGNIMHLQALGFDELHKADIG